MSLSRKLFFISIGLLFFACTDDPKTSSSSPTGNKTEKTYKPSVQTAVGIVLPQKTVAQGETVCMDVTVKDFNKIMSMQHSVNWDTKVLKFSKLQNFTLQSLSANNFGTTQVTDGNFGVSWYDPSLKGVSLNDGAKIYEVCFEAIGESGSSTGVRISGVPVVVEVSTVDERLLDIPTGKGKIVIR